MLRLLALDRGDKDSACRILQEARATESGICRAAELGDATGKADGAPAAVLASASKSALLCAVLAVRPRPSPPAGDAVV